MNQLRTSNDVTITSTITSTTSATIMITNRLASEPTTGIVCMCMYIYYV